MNGLRAIADTGGMFGDLSFWPGEDDQGALSVDADGILRWDGSALCPLGTYHATATYTHGDNTQTRALTIVVKNVLPPTFPLVHMDYSPPAPGQYFAHALVDPCVVGQLSYSRTFAAYDGNGLAIAASYAIDPRPYTSLPPGANLDSETGLFTCTFSSADAYQDYNFFIKATETATGRVDLLHVVLPVTVSGQGLDNTVGIADDWKTTDKNAALPLSLEPQCTSFGYPNRAAQLHVVSLPTNGTLEIDTGSGYVPAQCTSYAVGSSVRYVPNTGYSGRDEFIYYWTYNELDSQSPYGVIGTAETNRVRQYIQVGHNTTAKELPGTWVDLTPAAESACGDHQAILGVGGTTTVTLTLENPRGDDIPSDPIPTTGYWSLKFNRDIVRVYLDGREIMPGSLLNDDGSTFLQTVGRTPVTVALTVVGVSAGDTNIKAYWHPWTGQRDTIDTQVSYAGWFFWTGQEVGYTVFNADIDTDSNNDDWIDPSNNPESGTDDPIETEYPGRCLARYSGHADELAEVDIRLPGTTIPQPELVTGTLTFTGDIRVWTDRYRTTEIVSGTSWDLYYYYASAVPTVVYVEGDAAGASSMTWTVSAKGQSVSDAIVFSLLTASLTATNMAPLTIAPTVDPQADSATVVHLQAILNQITLPTGFDGITAAITATADVRGGGTSYDGEDGTWVYSPHNTTYVTNHTNAPWDPYRPYGTMPKDGDWGGAAFFATVADENGNRVKMNVTLAQDHVGYKFLHKEPGGATTEWVESYLHDGQGGLMLVGGGDHPAGAYQWFVDQTTASGHTGNVVVIGNKGSKTDQEVATAMNSIANEFLAKGALSVDVFVFDTDAGGDLTTGPESATAVAQDQQGESLGHEFLDKLWSAEAAYFMGGDQWPYVQLLRTDRAAASRIGTENNADRLSVGGTSAGMAILGNYVFTAEYLRDGSGLCSCDILNNYYTPTFYGVHGASIANDVMSLKWMGGALTETHFTDPNNSLEGETYFRLGRFLSFMAAVTLPTPAGLGQSSVKGIAVDNSTALTITADGDAKVWGQKKVYFASFSATTGNPSLVPYGTNEAWVFMSGVYIRWYSADDPEFSITTAWNTVPLGTGYAIYGLGGDGSFVRADGHLPLPFPQDE
jgi:cyanophycinase-like exopeptidase